MSNFHLKSGSRYRDTNSSERKFSIKTTLGQRLMFTGCSPVDCTVIISSVKHTQATVSVNLRAGVLRQVNK